MKVPQKKLKRTKKISPLMFFVRGSLNIKFLKLNYKPLANITCSSPLLSIKLPKTHFVFGFLKTRIRNLWCFFFGSDDDVDDWWFLMRLCVVCVKIWELFDEFWWCQIKLIKIFKNEHKFNTTLEQLISSCSISYYWLLMSHFRDCLFIYLFFIADRRGLDTKRRIKTTKNKLNHKLDKIL
jgi:hypothetical protein